MTHPVFSKKCPYCKFGDCKYCFNTRKIIAPLPPKNPRKKVQ